MTKWNCSYAYDQPCFADFVIEAETEAEALAKMEAALKAGKFDNVDCPPNWENDPVNKRVFVMDKADDTDTPDDLNDL